MYSGNVRFQLISTSEVRALPFGIAAESSVHYFIPSEVSALPLGVAVEQSVHYFWDYFSFFLSSGSHTFLSEGVFIWF